MAKPSYKTTENKVGEKNKSEREGNEMMKTQQSQDVRRLFRERGRAKNEEIRHEKQKQLPKENYWTIQQAGEEKPAFLPMHTTKLSVK